MPVSLTTLQKDFDTVSTANQGAWLTLLDINDEPTKQRVFLLGTDSAEYRKLDDADGDAQLAKAGKRGRMGTLTMQQIRARNIKKLAVVTKDWEGFIDDETGQKAECNLTNVAAVYGGFPHIYRQVDEFVNEPSNFGKKRVDEPSTGEDLASAMEEVAGNSQPGLKPNTVAAQA
jgi:hypothetical protein